MRSTWIVKKPFGPVFKSFIFIFVVIVVVSTSALIWYNQALAAPSDSEEKKNLVIKRGETTQDLVNRLSGDGLVKSPLAFRIYLKISGLDQKIQAGNFEIPMNLRGEQLGLLLTQGRFDKWTTLIEGLRKEEGAEILEKDFDIDKQEFLKKAKEGYLFPDTYLIPSDADVDQIIAIFEKNFDNKVGEDLIKAAAENGIGEKQLVIFASIVEREARSDSQRALIAGILIKRWKSGVALGTDATIQYALGYSSEEKTWWRKALTVEDLDTDSKFNTRKLVGLPPGPICSPGTSSIKAVANPKDSAYFYYLHDEEGGVHYAETLGGHEQNIDKYLK